MPNFIIWNSVFRWESIQEIYLDAQTCGLKSVNPTTIQNSNLAISWLEATFPELSDEAERGKLASVRAHPNALFDASLSLQVYGLSFLEKCLCLLICYEAWKFIVVLYIIPGYTHFGPLCEDEDLAYPI